MNWKHAMVWIVARLISAAVAFGIMLILLSLIIFLQSQYRQEQERQLRQRNAIEAERASRMSAVLGGTAHFIEYEKVHHDEAH